MSFSQEIKEELSRQFPAARHCQLAELAAIISACGAVSVRKNHRLVLLLESENILVIRKAGTLIRKLFRFSPEYRMYVSGEQKKNRIYSLAVPDPEQTARVLKAVKYLTERGVLRELSLPVNGILLHSSCCRRAFIRGAFLAAGSVSNPEKSYHLEIVCTEEDKAEQIREAVCSFDVDARVVQRKQAFVVYVKESDGISDIFNVMEAHQGLMKMENIRILRGISGKLNRSVNCETANLNKTVAASVNQTRSIEIIRDTIGLAALPAPLRQMAEVRLSYPDTPLAELGKLMDPPVGKSGVNHRLRKLKQIAEELK